MAEYFMEFSDCLESPDIFSLWLGQAVCQTALETGSRKRARYRGISDGINRCDVRDGGVES